MQRVTLKADSRRENTLLVAGMPVFAPPLSGPALPYNDDQIRLAMGVLDRSLAWLRRRFPGLPTTVVYIPSPLSVYRFSGDVVPVVMGRQPGAAAPTALVAKHSDLMCAFAHKATSDQGADFLDARPALRAAAATRVIHGPVDWFHLNEAGYRILGNLVVDRLQGRVAADTCSHAKD